jgi:hypothetical protein
MSLKSGIFERSRLSLFFFLVLLFGKGALEGYNLSNRDDIFLETLPPKLGKRLLIECNWNQQEEKRGVSATNSHQIHMLDRLITNNNAPPDMRQALDAAFPFAHVFYLPDNSGYRIIQSKLVEELKKLDNGNTVVVKNFHKKDRFLDVQVSIPKYKGELQGILPDLKWQNAPAILRNPLKPKRHVVTSMSIVDVWEIYPTSRVLAEHVIEIENFQGSVRDLFLICLDQLSPTASLIVRYRETEDGDPYMELTFFAIGEYTPPEILKVPKSGN